MRFNWRIQNRVSKLKKVSSCSVQLKRALCWYDVMGSYKLNAWYSFMSQFLTELGWMSSKNAFHSEFNRNRVDKIHLYHRFACMSINYSSQHSKIHCTECLLCLAMGSIQAFTVIRFNSSIVCMRNDWSDVAVSIDVRSLVWACLNETSIILLTLMSLLHVWNH